ncbi:MAG: type II toxin-antitoxin system VapC family toxin [Halobacteriota archaeon]
MIAILDTNALLIPWHFKIDVFEQLIQLGFVPSTIEPVLQELRTLAQRGFKGANVALSLSKRCTIVQGADGASVDERLINTALKYKAAVVTNDKVLTHELRKRGIHVITLRNKRYLQVDAL